MKLLKYFPLVKVDEKSHTISGLVTAEVPDKDGEICDYAAAKKAYLAWSTEAKKATEAAGQEISYGNMRLMHQIALGIAGKVSEPVIFDDDKKEIHIITEPADDNVWTKARKGFIRGFSQGGGYAFRKCNVCKTDIEEEDSRACPSCKKAVLVRYGPVIAEVSYVDNPCLKAATFSLVKADGSQELRKFAEEGKPDMSAASVAPLDIDGLVQKIKDAVLNKGVKYLVPDGQQLPYTKADGEPNHALMGAAWAALNGGYLGKKYEGVGKNEALKKLKALYEKEGIDTPDTKAKKAFTGILEKAAKEKPALSKVMQKGMYEVSRFADLLANFYYLTTGAFYEMDREEDGSDVPAKLQANLEQMVESFLAMAEEEAKELTAAAEAAQSTAKGPMYMAQTNNALEKAHSAVAHLKKMKEAVTAHSEKCMKMHKDHMEEMHSHCEKMGKILGAEEAESLSGGGEGKPNSIDPKAGGAPNEIGEHMKADGTLSMSKADFDAALVKASESAVERFITDLTKAVTEDSEKEKDNEEIEQDGKAKPVKKAAAGIGDRAQVPPIIGNGGPHIRVMPVTKADDGANGSGAAAAVTMSAAEVQAAVVSQNPADVLKLMKSARPAEIPNTLMGALSGLHK